MCTSFTALTDLGKGRLDSCLLLGLVPPCCLAQSLDL